MRSSIRSTSIITLLLLLGCEFSSITKAGPEAKPVPSPVKARLARDLYGMAHIEAPTFFGAGYAVGVAQVDDHGLDLQLAWSLYSPAVESLLTQQAIDAVARPGQVPPALQFDARGFPRALAANEPRPATLEEIRLTLEYMNFYATADEALARLDPDLRSYLEGFVAGANARFAQKSRNYVNSGDPRVRYMVRRGLHERKVTVQDALRAASAQAIHISVGLVQTWAGFIEGVAPVRDSLAKVRLPLARPTASNEFGFSGRVTQSGRPLIMVDPHLPTHSVWFNTTLTAVVRTPELVLDGAIPVGQPVALVGHALHPRTQSAIAINGTANAHTPSTCWYAPVSPALDTYATSATGGVRVPFTTRRIGRLTVREAGIHGRLIGQKRVRVGSEVREVGFLYRASKDHKYSVIETLWPAFRAQSVAEFHAALDRHAHPFWNMTIGISTPQRPSTVLYINNQISARRNPNPDGNAATIDDWNQFMDALNPATEWLGGYHSAAELPQILAEDSGRPFLHCHNCQPEMVTGQMPSHPYLIGGYAGYSNPRQLAGDRFYAEAVQGGRKLILTDAVALANHPVDLQLEEAVSKLRASLHEHAERLPLDVLTAAKSEMDTWTQGPVDGSASNPRIARVLLWIEKMKPQAQVATSTDLMRLVNGWIYPTSQVQFDPSSSLGEKDAQVALTQLAQVHEDYPRLYGSGSRTWGEIQRFRPSLFGQPFGSGPLDLAMGGAPNALLSVGGPVIDTNSGRVHLVTGGQNYVQLIEVGVSSLLKKSVSGTSDPTLAYASKMSELYAEGLFTPTGVQASEMTPGRLISSEVLEVLGTD